MLVVFGAQWCAYCRKLEAETLAHSSVANHVNATFVPVHLDFEKDRRIAEILEVRSLPTTVILSPEADLLGSVEGYVRPAEFSQVLQQSLDFQQTLAEERHMTSARR